MLEVVFSQPLSFLLNLLVGSARVQHLVVSQARAAPSLLSGWGCQIGHPFYCHGSFSSPTFSFPSFKTFPRKAGLPVASHLPLQSFLLFLCLSARSQEVLLTALLNEHSPHRPLASQAARWHCIFAGICVNMLACSCTCKRSESFY